MSGYEIVVRTLARFGVAANAAEFSQATEIFPAPGKQLVRVALMADVENKRIARNVKNVVHGDYNLDGADI